MKNKNIFGIILVLIIAVLSVVLVHKVVEKNEQEEQYKRQLEEQQIELDNQRKNFENELKQQQEDYVEQLKHLEAVRDLAVETKERFMNENAAIKTAVKNAIVFEIVKIEGEYEPQEDKGGNIFEYVKEKDNMFASIDPTVAELLEAKVWTNDEATITFKKVSSTHIEKVLLDGTEIFPDKDGNYTVTVKTRECLELQVISENTYTMSISEGKYYWM